MAHFGFNQYLVSSMEKSEQTSVDQQKKESRQGKLKFIFVLLGASSFDEPLIHCAVRSVNRQIFA
jgi:hypothetical protein